MTTYKTVVLTALEIEDTLIIVYRNYLMETFSNGNLSTLKNKSLGEIDYFVQFADDLVKSYKSGNFKKVFTQIKASNSKNLGGSAILATVFSAAVIVAAFIAVFSAIRVCIYYFFKSKYDINKWAKTQQAFLTEVIAVEEDTTALKREKFLQGTLNNLANITEFRMKRDIKRTKDTLKRETPRIINKETLSEDIEVPTPTPSDKDLPVDNAVANNINTPADIQMVF
jgi:hypothetical protein